MLNNPTLYCQDCGKPLVTVGGQVECSNADCELYKVTLDPRDFPLPESLAEQYRIVNRRINNYRSNQS